MRAALTRSPTTPEPWPTRRQPRSPLAASSAFRDPVTAESRAFMDPVAAKWTRSTADAAKGLTPFIELSISLFGFIGNISASFFDELFRKHGVG